MPLRVPGIRRKLRRAVSSDEFRLERLRRQRRRYPLGRLIAANLRDLFYLMRQSWFSLLCLALVLLSGITYLSLVSQPQTCPECPPDIGLALYDTLQLLIFQSSLDFPPDLLGRSLFLAIPLLGLFFLLQSIVDFARLLVNKSARRESWQLSLAATFRNHVIVCGLGRVGYRVVLQLLDAGYEVVVIEADFDSEFVPEVLGLKVPVIQGNARDSTIQQQAGIMRARSIVAAINDDMKNIEIALTARRRRPQIPTVLRIYHRALDVNLERRFGRNSAFSSSALAAPTFAAAALSQAIVQVIDLPEGLIGLNEFALRDHHDQATLSAHEERFHVRVLRRGAGDISDPPTPAAHIRQHVFLGKLADLEHLRLHHQEAPRSSFLQAAHQNATAPPPGAIIVCGLGKVGSRVLTLLGEVRPRPELVVICTPETPQRETAELQDRGIRVVRGDARDPALLREAGIDTAHALAALFSDDLLNVQIGLAARDLRPDLHLVLRVFSDVLAERLGALFGFNTAYSTSALAAPTLAAAAVRPEIDHAFELDGRLFATLAVEVREHDQLVGKQVRDLRTRGLIVVALRRVGGRRAMPALDEVLQVGDEVALLGALADLPA